MSTLKIILIRIYVTHVNLQFVLCRRNSNYISVFKFCNYNFISYFYFVIILFVTAYMLQILICITNRSINIIILSTIILLNQSMISNSLFPFEHCSKIIIAIITYPIIFIFCAVRLMYCIRIIGYFFKTKFTVFMIAWV